MPIIMNSSSTTYTKVPLYFLIQMMLALGWKGKERISVTPLGESHIGKVRGEILGLYKHPISLGDAKI